MTRVRYSSHRHPAFWGFAVHRVSGIGLALFLPVHFVLLGTALTGEASFDRALAWTDHGAVRFAEWALVVLLAAHLAGGLRILAIEFLPWSERQQTWVALCLAAAAGVGLLFALNLLA